MGRLLTTLRSFKGQFGWTRENAVAAWYADQYDASLDALVDLTGNGHHALFGSTVGADTNDPLLLPYSGEKYLYAPGVASNHARTPHAAAAAITGDLDIRARLDAWTSGSARSIIGNVNWNVSGYELELGTTNAIDLIVTLPSSYLRASTVPVPFVAGQSGWIRATRVASTGTVTFYTSEDGESWTQLGTPVTGTAGSITAATQPIDVGARAATGNVTTGRIYRAQVRDGIDGTLVADFDPSRSQEPHTSFVAATGETWTINRTSTGRKAVLVDRPLLLFGTDDYLEVPDHADLDFGSAEDATVVWVGRLHGTTANQALVAKKSDFTTAAGYAIDRGTGGLTPRVMLADGTNNPTATAPVVVAGTATLAALVRNGGLTGVKNGTAGTPATDTSVDASNAEVLRFGRLSGAGTSYSDMEFIGAAIFRKALTEAELARVAREFGAS